MTQPDPATLRLFIGLWPPPETHAALVASSQAWSWPAQARRTRPERLHVTLHFLGEVASALLPALRRELAVEWSGCELVLDQPVVWPGGIAVLEASVVPAPLAALHGVLAGRLRCLGVPVEERRYRPHVTLARKALGARPPATLEPVAWRAGPGFALVQSLPGGRGYETLQSFG
ncbi:RNA 2',3'-cyclic phosphodiesterase [Ramlibacter montanisoli]|uniref:RNA 2',3'-cyclic phosphodiesterase n=1 Tax=Ramlibacter montanisoli TaxID=2732512 RepID=A0A849KED4_9BURK|nr:RNA 2',3'-cyclic phosphodiesterase [Ramlibacter montanisoli]NNU43315.1 RNA 2',3'-cyclic phosphodiesterase [Ramlibacter montanisoli]